jgi:preprotein translocase subunit SecE
MAKATATAATPGIPARIQGFYQEVKTEMSKVAWPDKEELKSSTSIVLLMLAILAAIVGVFDFVFQALVVALLRFLG